MNNIIRIALLVVIVWVKIASWVCGMAKLMMLLKAPKWFLHDQPRVSLFDHHSCECQPFSSKKHVTFCVGFPSRPFTNENNTCVSLVRVDL